jgi:hypothetical protein
MLLWFLSLGSQQVPDLLQIHVGQLDGLIGLQFDGLLRRDDFVQRGFHSLHLLINPEHQDEEQQKHPDGNQDGGRHSLHLLFPQRFHLRYLFGGHGEFLAGTVRTMRKGGPMFPLRVYILPLAYETFWPVSLAKRMAVFLASSIELDMDTTSATVYVSLDPDLDGCDSICSHIHSGQSH